LEAFPAGLAAFVLSSATLVASSAGASTNLTDWLAAQTKVKSWSADFVQTRTLKALVQPLKSEGHIWFAAPNRFRWELGRPPQTIATRTTNELVIVYPRLKRVERYPLSGAETGSWRDMLALLEAGFPRSKGELETQFRVLSVSERDAKCEVLLQPKSSQARRWIQEIEIAFSTRDFSLAATELRFGDGSTLRNDFNGPALNAPVDETLFAPEIPADYTVVEPLGVRSKR
jgi:outer membrane lipoprotein-sorting protein